MAASTYSVSTSNSTYSSIWRKVQKGIVVAAQFGVEEWNGLKKLANYTVNWSAREITMELDVNQAYGAASIPEGGKEAFPSAPATSTATVTWIFLNKRSTISRTAQYIQQQQGVAGQLVAQIKWEGRKMLDAVRAKVGDMFYGFSSGTVALISSGQAGTTPVFKDLYGVSGLGGTSANRRVADLFQVGDRIAALNPSGPALRSIQTITAVDRSTNTITIDSAFTSAAANDLIVFANNIENTTLAGGTERNLDLVGLLDGNTSTSVHGVSSATVPIWSAYADTSAGRYSGIKLRKMKQNIENRGGGTLNTVYWANGVENDIVAQLQAGLRFTDAFSMEMDGAPKSKGVSFNTTRRVPDGYVFAFDSEASVQKMVLLPDPTEPGWDDFYKLQDDSGGLLAIDWLGQMCYINRANLAYGAGFTQQ